MHVICTFSNEQTIVFRPTEDLNRILHIHSVAPHRPMRLCTTTASTLLYEDWTKSTREVHWLDVSDAQPKPAAGKCVIHTQLYRMYDMCAIHNGDKHLLVAAAGEDGLFAYNMKRDQLEWKVDVKPHGMEKYMEASGVTTDGRGHLFVCDSFNGNRCIQMFSVSNGKYLACLLKDVERIGTPARICWCEKTSSLLAAFWVKEKWQLTAINLQY